MLADIETLVGEIRAAPEKFADARAIVRRSGFGTTRLFELLRQHYHTTPAGLLARARLDAAKRRPLSSDAGLVAIAGETGFDSLSVFHEHFRRATGLTPAQFRALRDSHAFTLRLPEDYPAARAVGRANATNPTCLFVPCHRVIGADGTLTGFAFGETIKRWLLDHERVMAAQGRAA